MKTITIEVSDVEWQTLEDGILDPVAWVQNVARVQARKIAARIVAAEQKRLIADPNAETIPATVEGILQSHFSQPGYLKATDRPPPEELIPLPPKDGLP